MLFECFKLCNVFRLFLLFSFTLLVIWYVEISVVTPLIKHDLSSYLAPAVALLKGAGAPYVNYFDIKPPVSIFFLFPWIYFFGYSLMSMVVLDVVLLTSLFLSFYVLLRLSSTKNISDLVYIFALFFASTTNQFSLMVTTETIGLLFVFVALILILTMPKYYLAWFVSGVFLFFAGQIKEVYVFVPCTLIVLIGLNHKPGWFEGVTAFAGWCIAGIFVWFLLYYHNAIGAYMDVLAYKADAFPLSNPFRLFNRCLTILVELNHSLFQFLFFLIPSFLFLYIFKRKIKDRQFSSEYHFGSQLHLLAVIGLFFLTILIGFAWQNKPFKFHYAITIWFPFMLIIGLCFSFLWKEMPFLSKRLNWPVSQWGLRYLLGAWFFVCLFPGVEFPYYVLDKFHKRIEAGKFYFPEFESQSDLKIYLTAKRYLKPDMCLLEVYGWAAGASYIYTGARPCSRYFLSNLITNEKIRKKYINDLLENPPGVVIYNRHKADLDVKDFEKKTFPWQLILSLCYQSLGEPSVYVASFSKDKMKTCFVKQF